MNIYWTYLDKTAATVKALKDFSRMQYIIKNTDDEIRQVEDRMAGVASPKISGMPRNPNPQAGEDRMIKGIEEIDVLKKRYQQAREYMDWFLPAWNNLSPEERFMLDAFYSADNEYGARAVDNVAKECNIARPSAYRKKTNALDSLTTLLYGRW